jgi:hypothetical protein
LTSRKLRSSISDLRLSKLLLRDRNCDWGFLPYRLLVICWSWSDSRRLRRWEWEFDEEDNMREISYFKSRPTFHFGASSSWTFDWLGILTISIEQRPTIYRSSWWAFSTQADMGKLHIRSNMLVEWPFFKIFSNNRALEISLWSSRHSDREGTL